MKDARYICNDTIDSKAADSLEKKISLFLFSNESALAKKYFTSRNKLSRQIIDTAFFHT